MVEDYSSTCMDTSEDLLVSSPLKLKDWSTLSLDAWHTLPAIAISGALGGKLLALPHDDEPILGSARDDSSLSVVFNRNNFIIENLVLEG